MENLRNRSHSNCKISDETETLHKLQNKSTFPGFKVCGNFDCLASENQTVVFINKIIWQFVT